ncbi:MAG: DUF349 domain-containing protein, partial [Steroidobacteraceae bacterium]|nr:DUF349 domain-containing protein [Steroidobacteraceae bacterium]
MSLLSRLFGKSPPEAAAAAVSQPAVPVETPPRPDSAARTKEEEASVSQAIAAGDMAAVGRWVLEGSSTRVRQAAAHAITNPDQLRELIRATRGGKDKSVYRILTTRRDELLAAERAAQQLQAEIDAAAAGIARHSERPCDASYATTLSQLEARWQAVATHATADLQGEVARQIERARDAIEQHHRTTAAEAERQRAAAVASAVAAEESRRLRDAEEQATAAATAEEARLLEAEREAAHAKHEADEAAARELVGLLRQAQAALDHGGTARAMRLRAAIAEKLPQAPALPVWFERKLHELDARLAELKDWKTFTVVPKRAELVQRMQSLIGAEMSAEELARQIRRLRDEWRTLKRGAGDESAPEELQQFEAAAERAYEPCREHFARQAEQRKENQARREALLERLEAFAAGQTGDQVDWRLVQVALVESRREWRAYAPVDQSAIVALQTRFHALVDDLQARLDAEYARNVQAKRDLIARTEALLAVDDIRQAIEAAKSLQREWKLVGLVPRHQDNALWDEFRKRCDAVFERSAQEAAAQGAALEGNQARAFSLCGEMEQIAALAGEPLLASVKQLDELCAEFESLDLPRASARDLRQRFGRAIDACSAAIQRERAVAARRGWADLFAADGRVRSYALAVAKGASPDDCAALRASAESAIAGLDHAPHGTRAILEERLAMITTGEIGADL